MKLSLVTTVLGVAVVLSVVGTDAQQPVPYSVHIFLVPPLIQAKCPIGTFWYPSVACSVCLCLTGGISRCGARPGCDPNDFTTTTSTAPTADVAVNPGGGGAIIGVASHNGTGDATAPVPGVDGAAPAPPLVPPLDLATTTTAVPPTTTATAATTTRPTGFRLFPRESRTPRMVMRKRIFHNR